MILSDEEKLAFEKIAAISLKDKATIKDVLYALLSYTTIEALKGNESEIIIPYLCKLKLSYKETQTNKGVESIVDIQAEPLPSLMKEYVCIKNNEDPPTKRYFLKQNKLHIKEILKLDEFE